MKLLAACLLLFSIHLHAQTHFIEGRVLDSVTQLPIEFASIYCKHNKIGDNTDSTGYFKLAVNTNADTLVVSFMGYEKAVVAYSQPTNQTINIYLKSILSDLDEVMVTEYKDPGKHVAEMVVKNKGRNDITRFDNEASKEYNKLKISLTHLSSSQQKGFFKNISKVYASTLGDTTNTEAPLFFSEKFFLDYGSNKGGIYNDVKIKIAEKNLGLPTDDINHKLDHFMIDINPYDNVIPILKTTFISPFSEAGLHAYKYKIKDTITCQGENTIRLQFKPYNSTSNTFEGIAYIQENNWGICYLEMKSSKDANINYVNNLQIIQQYVREQTTANMQGADVDSIWVLKKNTTTIELKNGLDLLNLPFKTDALSKMVKINSTSVYSDYIVNDTSLNAHNFITRFKEDPNYLVKGTNPTFKSNYRLEKLNTSEQAIYKMADSLKHDNAFVNTSRFSAFMLSGFYDVGYYKLGQLTSLVSSNPIEGIRNRLGIWTTERLSQRFNFNGYVAYGSKDERLKGGLGIKYVPSRMPYIKTEIVFQSDYNAIVTEDDEIDKDNFFTLGLRKKLPYLQEFTKSLKFIQEYDISHTVSAKIIAQYRDITPSFNYRYYDIDDQTPVYPATIVTSNSISDAQIGIKIRYARNENSRFSNFDKQRFGSAKPIFTLHYIYGFELNNQTIFDYHKISFGITQELNLQPKGRLFYDFTAGKIFGTLPSLLLFMPNGNSSYVASKFAFNNMQPYEYAADQYAQLFCVYNAGGVVFDKVPLLKKLKLRERIITNVYWGTLSSTNIAYNQTFPVKSIHKLPYIESGFGVGNILSIFYIDCIWRLTERSTINSATNFGVYLGTKVSF